jgi:type IV pilus assembly protein PilA
LLIVVAIILIIAAIAIPNLLRSKMAANEASAVASLRTLNTSIIAYSTTYSTDPPTLASMGPASTASSTAADLVDNLLGVDPAVKSGYSIAYAAVVATPITQYTLIATPVSSSTGQRKFFTDQSGVIRQTTDGGTPSASSTPIGG